MQSWYLSQPSISTNPWTGWGGNREAEMEQKTKPLSTVHAVFSSEMCSEAMDRSLGFFGSAACSLRGCGAVLCWTARAGADWVRANSSCG